MKTFKNFISVVDYQTLIVSALAVASTWVCLYFNWTADIPTALIGLAVVFPIVFSINTAYKRREEALKHFSGVKGNLIALYYAHRDWVPDQAGREGESEHAIRVRDLIDRLLKAIRDDLWQKTHKAEKFQAVYALFSQLSKSNEAMRAAKVTAGEISRANQFVSKVMVDYECMRNIAFYRTPLSLRAYSSIFLNFFPIAFGPYFATLCTKSENFPYVGYMVAVLYSLVLVTLDNIQEDLEDPFDGVGVDDVKLDVVADYHALIAD